MIVFTADTGNIVQHMVCRISGIRMKNQFMSHLLSGIQEYRKKKVGTFDKLLTLNVDLAETILDAAEIKPHQGMQGRDISNLYLPCKDNDEKCKKAMENKIYYEFPQISSSTIEPTTALVLKK